MLAEELVAGIGEIVFSGSDRQILSTYALGSCVAVVIHHPLEKKAALAHIALSDSRINPEKAKNYPGYFADIAIPNMIDGLKKMKCPITKDLNIKIIGGAMLIQNKDFFAIGSRNVEAARKFLKTYGLNSFVEDVGNTISRTVRIDTVTGIVTVSNAKIGKWTI